MFPVSRECFVLFCTFVIVIYSRFSLSTGKHVTINEVENFSNRISWIKEMKAVRSDIKECSKQTRKTLWECFKLTTLRMFDDLMSSKEILLWEGIRFVQDTSNNVTLIKRMNAVGKSTAMDGGDSKESANNMQDSQQRKDMQHLTWFDQLAMRLAATLKTHVLEINLKQLTDWYMLAEERRAKKMGTEYVDPNGTARHRRHRYNMIITMMFGVTALGAILVPIGFQMLSVVSGKALLLAKMALLLASINGLKRVANSGVHYGLYHVPGEHYGGGYYDRGDVHHPRQAAGIAVAQPIDIGI